MKLGLVARDAEKLDALCNELGAERFSCDASQPEAVLRLFDEVDVLVCLRSLFTTPAIEPVALW